NILKNSFRIMTMMFCQLKKTRLVLFNDRCKQMYMSKRDEQTCCPTSWDHMYCWHRAQVGEVIRILCADITQLFADNQGFVSRNCTEEGWSELNPHYEDACEFKDDKTTEPEVGQSYHVGSIVILRKNPSVFFSFNLVATFYFCLCRKFHCTRNYIHINLFFSFILRASAVFIKDLVLFNDENMDHCFMSTTACKSAVAFFQFSILANYFWLLVEGMYLQTLLALTFVFQKKYFWWYILIGWGGVGFEIVLFIISLTVMYPRCWDDTDVAFIWWIIKGPITASLLVNFIIFLNVIRILVQKLTTPGVSAACVCRRLAKSTLLLIPLFGMHYMVFAFLPEHTGAEARLFIELGLGSFQGFVVALLYCFLNGEVQAEMKKRFWKWQTQSYLSYSKRRRTLLNESSTVTQTSVLDKSSPLEQQGSEGTALTPNNASLV
uniref:Growth hormone releasing hormone receptor b n=1 Tax=Cyprinodon variegatus TaxID=28743 RepID=A0A3Q2DMJ2_CYPVA